LSHPARDGTNRGGDGDARGFLLGVPSVPTSTTAVYDFDNVTVTY